VTPHQITAREARAFWAHPSQWIGGTPDQIPETGVVYWACGPICGGFRDGPYPGVLLADYGAKPEGWGRLTEPARAILRAVWKAYEPQLILGLTESNNRAALAFNRRIGFAPTGLLTLASGQTLTLQGWRP
jgi:hypothetical protein